MLEQNKIYCGDCQTVMHDIDSNSLDCIITDPPYQLSSPNTKKATKGFMGKSWDICPSVEIWRECLRVLKPGAFAFVMCIPRQDCLARMICRLEDAGFKIGFSSIYWTYATGFPKAQNLSKAADKRAGVPSLGKAFNVAGCGERKDLQNSKQALKYRADYGYKPELKTEQAKALDGAYSGMQLKPAVEIVIVAMKHIEEKTYLDQAISNKHGATWLNDCRIPFENSKTEDLERGRNNKNASYKKWAESVGGDAGLNAVRYEHCNKGRFPANVLCEDDVLDDGRVTKSVGGTGIRSQTDTFKCTEGHNQFNYGDIGSYSRYFSLDAWFAERITHLPKEAQKTFPWLIIPKASKGEKNRGCEDLQNVVKFSSKNESDTMLPSKENKAHLIKGNFHPTCKSIKLMSWLITLASREGDIILDPFCGSGTTLIAAKMLGRQYIGIEREEDYCEIARKRIAAVPTRLNSYNVL